MEISKNLTINGPGAASLTISGNSINTVFSIDGGAVVSISGVTIANGYTGYFIGGGGILNNGTLTVTNSTFSGNSGGSGGGGGIINNGTLIVTNSTFSGNSATFGYGGGILNEFGTLALTNSTFSGNSASQGGGIFNNGPLTVKSTILANSPSGSNCAIGAASGEVAVSSGYNLSDDASCPFNQTTDQNSVNPMLGPLRDNGGPTYTMALLVGSPAIDAIPTSPTNYCTDLSAPQPQPVLTDQRGVARPQPTGSNCDIGAFEVVQTFPFATFTPKLNISGSGANPPQFNLNIAFTLGTNNAAIFPLTHPVVVTVGSYSVTVPAASFKKLMNGSKAGGYVYSGTINGVPLAVQISVGNGTYSLQMAAGTIPATTNPVPVTLTIGNNTSTAGLTANFY